MERKIFVPDGEQAGKLIESAWKKFCILARREGLDINDDTAEGLVKDCFVSGYCLGFNESLNIVIDQLNAEYMVNGMLKN